MGLPSSHPPVQRSACQRAAASRHPGEQKTSPHPRAHGTGPRATASVASPEREGRSGRRTRERSCRGLSAAAMSSRREARPEASARWCATESPAGERQCAHARKRARFASACVAASGRSARKVSPFFTGASATSARPRPSIDTHATRGGEGPSLRASIARVRAIESSSAAAVRADAPHTAAGADPASRSRLARFVHVEDIGTKPSSPRASRNARARSARAPRPLTARESFREQRAQLRRDFASETKGCAFFVRLRPEAFSRDPTRSRFITSEARARHRPPLDPSHAFQPSSSSGLSAFMRACAFRSAFF